jgi:hypothetical protein
MTESAQLVLPCAEIQDLRAAAPHWERREPEKQRQQRRAGMTQTLQTLLPFAEREYVDAARGARILGVSLTTVYRLGATLDFYNKPLITMVEYRRGSRKRILYSSIVSFCDKLRAHYMIADRRPALANRLFRHRDEDLLPFPLADTIRSAEALEALGYLSNKPLVALIEEGHFEAYRLVLDNPWRISRSSFAAYLHGLHDKPIEAVAPYKRVPRPREIGNTCA